MSKLQKSLNEWKKELDPEVFRVTREKGTEHPYTGKLLHNTKTGIYTCSNCDHELFLSDAKYDSGCGWPAFYDPVTEDSLKYHDDSTFGMKRTEVTCGTCGAHLGHVFPDGPQDKTGQRYCINSVALKFKKK